MTDSFAPAASGFAPAPGAPDLDAEGGSWSDWFTTLDDSEAASYRYLLLLRFAVFNLVAGALLGAAWLKGWVGLVVGGDTTQLVLVITLVFLFGVVNCARKVYVTSVELNQANEPQPDPSSRAARYLATAVGRDGHGRALAASALKLKLGARIGSVRHTANSLVFLGLIGTVIGFIIALSGVDPESAADVEAIGPMVSTLISGMSVALHTTLVGAILNVWLMIDYRLLEGGTIRLVTAIVELGERHAQS